MTMRDNYVKLKIDKKNREIVFKELKKLDLEEITAGIHASDGNQKVSNNGFRLIDVAVQNEYGNEWINSNGTRVVIPATHFISRIVQDPKDRNYIITTFKAALHTLIKYGAKSGYAVRDFIEDVGSSMRDLIKHNIDLKIFLPNAPSTIRKKGFDKRLYDKGTLYNAIKYRSKKTKVINDR